MKKPQIALITTIIVLSLLVMPVFAYVRNPELYEKIKESESIFEKIKLSFLSVIYPLTVSQVPYDAM